MTEGPGLVGALLIGVNAAKAVAFAHNIPLVGVHHIAGHIYANRLVKRITIPFVSLVVSGGHTEFVYMKEHGSFEVIGETRDDAAGEAYDKVARTLSCLIQVVLILTGLLMKDNQRLICLRAWLEPDRMILALVD